MFHISNLYNTMHTVLTKKLLIVKISGFTFLRGVGNCTTAKIHLKETSP